MGLTPMLSDAQVEAVLHQVRMFDYGMRQIVPLIECRADDDAKGANLREIDRARDTFRLALEDCIRAVVRDEMAAPTTPTEARADD